MNWSILHIDIFGLVSAHLSAEELLTLEYVCKTWKENLGEQWIWKQIATKNASCFQLTDDILSWKDVSLKQLFIIKNMKEKRCITRSFASIKYLGRYRLMEHETSVQGDEAIISWIEAEDYGEYYTSSFIGNELVNLNTGKRTSISVPNRCAIMTKNYFITSPKGSPEIPESFTEELLIMDRSTNKTFSMTIPEMNSGSLIKNTDPKYKDSIAAVCTTHSHDASKLSFVVLDLNHRTTETFEIPPLGIPVSLGMQCQFHGKYLAIVNFIVGDSRKMVVRIFDTEANKIIYDEIKDASITLCIVNDRVVIVNVSKTDLQVTVTDFKNKSIGEFATADNLRKENHNNVSARLYGDILLVVCGSRAWFVDVKHFKLLCSLHLIGWNLNGITKLHDMIGAGKFVISSFSSTRVIDFESIAIIKEFKPKIILPENDYGIAESWKRPIAFHELMKFAQEVIGDKSATKYASMVVSEDEEGSKTVRPLTRTSLIFLATKGSTTDAALVNKKATEIWAACKILPHRAVNMVDVKFDYDPNAMEVQTAFLGKNEAIRGRAVLYKEMLVDGKWIPIDLDTSLKIRP